MLHQRHVHRVRHPAALDVEFQLIETSARSARGDFAPEPLTNPVLAATLAAGPCGDLTFIAGDRGQPLTEESFGNVFKDACRAAGVPGSAHGVRKIAATRAANAGATVAQLEAIFGWTGGTMASLYTQVGRSQAALDRGNAQARERFWNIYSRT